MKKFIKAVDETRFLIKCSTEEIETKDMFFSFLDYHEAGGDVKNLRNEYLYRNAGSSWQLMISFWFNFCFSSFEEKYLK